MDPWVEKQERMEMKKMKAHYDMLGYIADAQFGVSSDCPCGAIIVDEVSTNSKDKDFYPEKTFFTCRRFKDDEFHFRQPWVIGVHEEVRRLKREVGEMAKEIVELRKLIPRG